MLRSRKRDPCDRGGVCRVSCVYIIYMPYTVRSKQKAFIQALQMT